MKDEADGEEDDAHGVGEEENVVKPVAPKGGGEEKEDVQSG